MRPVTKPLPPSALVGALLDAKISRRPDSLTLMREQLQATIGDYCSFCEVPINVTQAVASKQSRQLKRTPTLADWSNLLLACDFCQVHRTADVTALSDYLWPDTDATFSLDGTSPFLYALKDVTYVVKPNGADATASNSSTRSLVIVTANQLSPVYAKAARTIDLFQLNTPFYDATTNTFTITQSALQARIDPRVDLRTRAWMNAAEAIANLRQVQALTAYPASFDAAVKVAAALAHASGFWSGWMTSFWAAFSDTALIRRTLIEISKRAGYQVTGFQTFPDGGSPPWTLFTGTAVDRLKL